MTAGGLPEIYFRKSERALDDAKELFASNRTESACSRTYYAMFNAARAALLILGSPGSASKSHDGLIRVFGEHVVLGGHLDKRFGRSLNDVERLRRIADYIGDPPSVEDTAWAIEQAEAFVAAVREKFMDSMPSKAS